MQAGAGAAYSGRVLHWLFLRLGRTVLLRRMRVLRRGCSYTGSDGRAYGTSKAYKIMFARELAGRVPEVDFFAVHPGKLLALLALSWVPCPCLGGPAHRCPRVRVVQAW